jgi:hypothetical protein
VDHAAYVIAATYLIAQVFRIVPTIDGFILMIVIWPVASNVIWCIIYYFIFEMNSVYLTLRSKDYKDNL